MKARLVEDINFERGQDPKEAMEIGIPVPSKNEILDLFTEEEKWQEIERFVNDNLLDSIYRKFQRAKPEDAIAAISTIIEEQLDNWYQTVQEEDES